MVVGRMLLRRASKKSRNVTTVQGSCTTKSRCITTTTQQQQQPTISLPSLPTQRRQRLLSFDVRSYPLPNTAFIDKKCFFSTEEKLADNVIGVEVVDNNDDTTTTCKYENLVQKRIKEMITNKDNHYIGEDLRKSISNEELEARFNEYKRVFDEAESCLSDLRETLFEVDDEQYREECNCAEGALNNALNAYVDLLEDLRRSNQEQLHAFNEIRSSNASNLKRLRKELDSIIAVVENRKLAAS